MSDLEDDKRRRLTLDIAVPLEAFLEFRGTMFEQGLSLQEFFSFIILCGQMKHDTVMNLIEMAKEQKIKNGEKISITSKPSSPNAIYNLLEQRSPLKQQK